ERFGAHAWHGRDLHVYSHLSVGDRLARRPRKSLKGISPRTRQIRCPTRWGFGSGVVSHVTRVASNVCTVVPHSIRARGWFVCAAIVCRRVREKVSATIEKRRKSRSRFCNVAAASQFGRSRAAGNAKNPDRSDGASAMIILFNPRSTKPRNRRLPLSVLALGAVLEGREAYEIVDGNLDDNPTATILRLIAERDVEMLGVTVMPGPQMAAAVDSCKEIRFRHPKLTIVWGGYFPSIYTDAALNAKYVDYVVRGQGEDTLLELLEALRGKRKL